MIGVRSPGSFKKTLQFLDRLRNGDAYDNLNKFGQMGVDALSNATPQKTGLTSKSWRYDIVRGKTQSGIVWSNTNVNNGANIAILLQYGHGTGTGGYVAGYDYINPAMRPIFDKIADDVWREMTTM